jgi:CheY-like chemotaxis protein
MSPPHIVAIEDNSADISLLRIALDTHGETYDLTVLRDGEEALRFIETQATHAATKPCVIIVDLHLPKYDGLEILAAVKQTQRLTRIQVVVLSSIARPEDQREILRSGGLYLDKPATFEGYVQLAAQIIALCGQSGVAIAAEP